MRSWLSLSGGMLLLHVRTAGARYPLRIDPFVQGTKLSGGTANNEFGSSVALSADGKTALVGAPYDEDGSRSQGQAGAAFVFVLSGSKWEQQGSKLTGTGDEPIYFGNSVALSANGNTALVGAYETAVGGKEAEGFDQGAVYVFTRSGPKHGPSRKSCSAAKKNTTSNSVGASPCPGTARRPSSAVRRSETGRRTRDTSGSSRTVK